jgi:predicted chitinase
MAMANYFVPSGQDVDLYGQTTEGGFNHPWKITVIMNGIGTIGLWQGYDYQRVPLELSSNNPGVIDYNEDPPNFPNDRLIRIVGRRPGFTILDAREKLNPTAVWCSVQVEVLTDQLTERLLSLIMPQATSTAITRYLNPLITGMRDNGINTHLRMAHFLAQLGHESGDMRFPEEIASGEAYEGRNDLGNTAPGDGKRFKGRGLIQLTGRANYTLYGNARGQDFVTPPNNTLIATDPFLAVDVSCWFWTTHGLNAFADNDNVNEITRRINGGFNGLADRTARLARAKRFLP